jgi:polyisoprenoid-binding protein YceI
MQKRRKVLIGAATAAVVLIVAAVAGIWWYLRDDAPDEVSLAAAVEQIDDSTTTTAAGDADSTATTSPTDDGAISGSWTIDTESGAFDFETATGTFVGFRIEEELAVVGSTTAVGRTGDVTGSIEIDGTTLTAASFEVDLTTITTNESRRDDRVQSALETDQFPTATFTLTEPVELGETAANGEAIAVTAIGELTIHGVTQTVRFPLEAQLTGGTVVVVGSLDIVFSDYDVEVPEAQIVLSVEDNGVLELQFLLTPA